MSKYCLSLAGCARCVAAARERNVSKCPLCRAEPFETNELHGFDEIIKELGTSEESAVDYPYTVPDNSDE